MNKVLVLIAVFVLASGCSGNTQKIASGVQKAIEAHRESKDFHQWIESSNHPEKLLENQEITCKELQSLSPERLSIFYSALLKFEGPCYKQLIEKIESYYELHENQDKAQLNSFGQNEIVKTRKVSVNSTQGPVFWYGERGWLDKKEVSLTFDDGPHPRLTPKLLDILDEFNLKATFFVLGKNAKAYPVIIEEIVKRGHILANHSHSHHNLPKYSIQHGVNEIEKGFDEILKITNQVEPFFRFPYGAKTSALQEYLKSTNTATFFWDVDTLDWKKTNPKELLKYSLEQVYKYNNGIVLFHDVQPQTISMMRSFISELILNDYKFAQHVDDINIKQKR